MIVHDFRRDTNGNIISEQINEPNAFDANSPVLFTGEIPDPYYRIKITKENGTQLTEVYNYDEIGENKFYCDYENCKVYGADSLRGSKVTLIYYGRGQILTSADYIISKVNSSGEVVELLSDILENGADAIEVMTTLGGVAQVLAKLDTQIEEGNEIVNNISTVKTQIDTIQSDFTSYKTTMDAKESAFETTVNTNMSNFQTTANDNATAFQNSVNSTIANNNVSTKQYIDNQVGLIQSMTAGQPYTSLAALNADLSADKTKYHIIIGSDGVQEVDTLTVTGVPTTSGNVTISLNGVSTNVAVTTGTAEVASLTVSSACTVDGNVTVTLNGVATTVALTSATQNTATLVATAIRGATFSGWTTGGTGTTVTFTSTTVGIKTDATYSAGSTGATGTMTTTTQGVDADTTTSVATKIRNASYTGWTTSGTGTSVTFTKNTVGTNTPIAFSAGTTGVTTTIAITTQGVAPSTTDWFYWNGSAWIDGGVWQGKVIADGSITTDKIINNSVTPKKTSFISVKDDSFVLSGDVITGVFINTSYIYQTGQGSNYKVVIYSLSNNVDYKITKNISSRFRMVLYNTYPTNLSTGQLVIDNPNLTELTFNSSAYNFCAILFTNTSEDFKMVNLTLTQVDSTKTYKLNDDIIVGTKVDVYNKYYKFVSISSMSLTGTWGWVNNYLAMLGKWIQSKTANNYMSYTFTGTGVNLHYFTGTNKGIALVSVDGKIITLDMYESEETERILAINGLSNSTHTITLVVTGTKNTNSSDCYVNVDYMSIEMQGDKADEINKADISRIDTNFSNMELLKTSGIKSKLLHTTSLYQLSSANGLTVNPNPFNLDSTSKCILNFDLSGLNGKKIKKASLKLTNYWTTQTRTNSDNDLSVGLVLKPVTSSATWSTYNGTNTWETPGVEGLTDVKWIDSNKIYFLSPYYTANTVDVTNTIKEVIENGTNNNGIILKWINTKTNKIFNSSIIRPVLLIEYYDRDDIVQLSTTDKFRAGISALIDNYKVNLYDWDSTPIYQALYTLYMDYNNDDAGQTLMAFLDNFINESGVNSGLKSLYQAELSRLILRLYDDKGITKYANTITDTIALYTNTSSTAANGCYLIGNANISELSYFALPFLVEYAKHSGDNKYVDTAVNQMINLYFLLALYSSDRLIYQQYSNDKSKGWGRGVGWFFAGLAKLLEYDSVKSHEHYNILVIIFKDLAEIILKYQLPSGLWNYILGYTGYAYEETSSACLFAYAFDIGLKEGLLPSKFAIAKYNAITGVSNKMITGMELNNVFQYNGGLDQTLDTDINYSDIGWGLAMFTLLNMYKYTN